MLRALPTRITESMTSTVIRMAMTITLSLNFNFIFFNSCFKRRYRRYNNRTLTSSVNETPVSSGGIAAMAAFSKVRDLKMWVCQEALIFLPGKHSQDSG
jgi:hypothetical protein